MKSKVCFLAFIGVFLFVDLIFVGRGLIKNSHQEEMKPYIFSQNLNDSLFVLSFLKLGCNIVVIPAHWDSSKIYMKNEKNEWSLIRFKYDKTCKIDGNLFMFKKSSQPTVYISTESGSMEEVESSADKTKRESGKIYIVEPTGEFCYNGKLKSIKGRGNWTWRRNKKPFNIKLENKAFFLGLDESESFCLLSNYSDYSNIRNWLAYKSAEEIGFPNPIKTHYVSLWIDGVFRGLYLLTEKAEVSESGVDIKRQGKELANDISGGYFLELDQLLEDNEDSPGFNIHGERYANILYPKNPTEKQIGYICNFMNDAVTALISRDGINKETGKYYLDYFDINTFVKYYLLNEVLFNVDGGVGSFKLYKNSDSINAHLMAGPAWDFDMSMGRGENEIYPENSGWIRWPEWSFPTHPETLIMSSKLQYHTRDIKFLGLLYELSKHKDFMDGVRREFFDNFLPIAKHRFSEEIIDSLYGALKNDIDLDNITNRTSDELGMSDYSVLEMKRFMARRIRFLSQIWGDSLSGYHKVSLDYGRRYPGYYRQMDLFIKDKDTLSIPLHARTQSLSRIVDEDGRDFQLNAPIISDKNLKFEWAEEPINTSYWIGIIKRNYVKIFQILTFFLLALLMFYVYKKK